MNSEELNFKISLSGTYHSKVPRYSISLDDTLIKHDYITVTSNEIELIEFTIPVTEEPHLLKIRLENKDSTDTIKDETPNGTIYKDMLLNIVDIAIDELSLGNLRWTAKYELDEPQEYNGSIITELPQCVNLGWNGTYILSFTSPFYIWLLENL